MESALTEGRGCQLRSRRALQTGTAISNCLRPPSTSSDTCEIQPNPRWDGALQLSTAIVQRSHSPSPSCVLLRFNPFSVNFSDICACNFHTSFPRCCPCRRVLERKHYPSFKSRSRRSHRHHHQHHNLNQTYAFDHCWGNVLAHVGLHDYLHNTYSVPICRLRT